jgi:hypothetical protein
MGLLAASLHRKYGDEASDIPAPDEVAAAE